jgi:hypothetical protein
LVVPSSTISVAGAQAVNLLPESEQTSSTLQSGDNNGIIFPATGETASWKIALPPGEYDLKLTYGNAVSGSIYTFNATLDGIGFSSESVNLGALALSAIKTETIAVVNTTGASTVFSLTVAPSSPNKLYIQKIEFVSRSSEDVFDFDISATLTGCSVTATNVFSGKDGRPDVAVFDFQVPPGGVVDPNLTISFNSLPGISSLRIDQAEIAYEEKRGTQLYGKTSTTPTANMFGFEYLKLELLKQAVAAIRSAFDRAGLLFSRRVQAADWAALTAYSTGDFVIATGNPGGAVYKATSTGTSGATIPSGMANGSSSTASDGSVNWSRYDGAVNWKTSTAYTSSKEVVGPDQSFLWQRYETNDDVVSLDDTDVTSPMAIPDYDSGLSYSRGVIVKYQNRYYRANPKIRSSDATTTVVPVSTPPPDPDFWGTLPITPRYVYVCDVSGTSTAQSTGAEATAMANGDLSIAPANTLQWKRRSVELAESDGSWTTRSSDRLVAAVEIFDSRIRTAFRVSRPSDVGRPGIVPNGLKFTVDDGATLSVDDALGVPRLATIQPWMISAGIYAAHEDFWNSVEYQPLF